MLIFVLSQNLTLFHPNVYAVEAEKIASFSVDKKSVEEILWSLIQKSDSENRQIQKILDFFEDCSNECSEKAKPVALIIFRVLLDEIDSDDTEGLEAFLNSQVASTEAIKTILMQLHEDFLNRSNPEETLSAFIQSKIEPNPQMKPEEITKEEQRAEAAWQAAKSLNNGIKGFFNAVGDGKSGPDLVQGLEQGFSEAKSILGNANPQMQEALENLQRKFFEAKNGFLSIFKRQND